jgi:hypothetical protein
VDVADERAFAAADHRQAHRIAVERCHGATVNQRRERGQASNEAPAFGPGPEPIRRDCISCGHPVTSALQLATLRQSGKGQGHHG